MSVMERDLQALHEQNMAKAEEIERLREREKQLQGLGEDLSRQLHEAHAQLQQKYLSYHAPQLALSREVHEAAVRGVEEKAKQHLDHVTSALQNQIETLQQTITRQQTQLRQHHASQERVKVLEGEVSWRTQQMESLQKQLTQTQYELNSLKNTPLHVQYESALKQIQQLENHLQQQQQHLQNVVASLEQPSLQQQQQLEQKYLAQIHQLQITVSEKNQQLSACRQELDQMLSVLDRLRQGRMNSTNPNGSTSSVHPNNGLGST
eukprot:TRINITY_DN8011_c0_g1_i3.p1 TRINITY_DN8011_c0_g1~~TRINITY_DN8011_c0_g1_i3.p1  ORF type:complete len:264 (-),score=51.56 TRINITY_DN8011_c0_g1_i3:113-904(-)